jgi:large subunit ribosomal protein L29
MKKAHDLRDLAVEELENRVREKSEELMNLRIQLNMRQLDNPLRVRQTRREIAVLRTVINQKKGAR